MMSTEKLNIFPKFFIAKESMDTSIINQGT